MASAAPAYRYDYSRGAYAYPQPDQRPRVRVVPGRRGQVETLDPRLVKAAKVAIIVMIAFAILGFARVALSATAVTTSIEAEQISSQVDSARAAGNVLEVQESALSNPTYVKNYATNELGMSAPASVETIALGADEVAVDENGSLSLSKSLAVAAQG